MEKPKHLLLGYCWRWGCAVFARVEHVGYQIACPSCGTPVLVQNYAPFGELEWIASPRIDQLETCAFAFGRRLSPRQRRLLFAGLARLEDTRDRNSSYWEAVRAAEQWADEGNPPPVVDELRRRFANALLSQTESWDWFAALCVEEYPDFDRRYEVTALQRMFTDAYRDLIPNPFVPLTWNREWFTSTVRDLAAHIYESRDFSAMPILGDALMDAGCDHELIQDHCRTTKPHARGCWVVDGVLGKSVENVVEVEGTIEKGGVEIRSPEGSGQPKVMKGQLTKDKLELGG